LRTLGFEENIIDNDFTKCLRQEVVKWACTIHHLECTIATLHKLDRYLARILKNIRNIFL